VCIKLVALSVNRYQRSSSQLHKGWWRLVYTLELLKGSSVTLHTKRTLNLVSSFFIFFYQGALIFSVTDNKATTPHKL